MVVARSLGADALPKGYLVGAPEAYEKIREYTEVGAKGCCSLSLSDH